MKIYVLPRLPFWSRVCSILRLLSGINPDPGDDSSSILYLINEALVNCMLFYIITFSLYWNKFNDIDLYIYKRNFSGATFNLFIKLMQTCSDLSVPLNSREINPFVIKRNLYLFYVLNAKILSILKSFINHCCWFSFVYLIQTVKFHIKPKI